MQNWIKEGLIFDFNELNIGYQYAAVPTGIWLDDDIMRIFFTSRNHKNQSVPFFLDYDFSKKSILNGPTKCIIDVGKLGTFDDSGVMISSIVEQGQELLMYYVGWNLGVTVPFRNSIGLAKSKDKGLSFTRVFEGPIMDRTKEEPYFCASCCILFDESIYKIWYQSCSNWTEENGQVKHYYHIKYATSKNGIDWIRNQEVAIDYKHKKENALSVPRVLKEDGIYKMWFSYRGSEISDFYRIGYAESIDGKVWKRLDHEINFDVSDNGWDSMMLCYPFVFNYKKRKYMLYNGNDYGKTGFGIAILEQ